METVSRRFSSGLFGVLLAILFWLPLPSGSKPQWAVGLLVALVALLGIAWLLGWLFRRVEVTRAFQQAKVFHLGFLLVLGWVWLQQCPLPADWVSWLSPRSWLIQAAAYEALGQPLPSFLTLSSDPFSTRVSAFLTLAYYLLFCLCLLLVDEARRLRQLAWLLVSVGIFQAVFGSLSTLSGLEVLLFEPKTSYLGVATGTYVNRNSFAGCLEMTLAVGMGLLIAQLNEERSSGFGEWLRNALKTLMSSKVILRAALAVMVIGLVLSRSRMGNTAFFSSLMLVGFIYIICRKKLSRGVVILFVSLLVVDLAIVSQWFGLEKVVERIEQTSMDKETRPSVSGVTLSAIQDYALVGSGVGTFYTTLPGYHDGSWKGFYDLAHNDFLQFALEFGLFAFCLLAILVLVSVWHSVQAMRLRRCRLMVGMGFSSLMGILAIMIHSSVDFNLQIPANSGYFVCLMALSVLARYVPGAGKVGQAKSHRKNHIKNYRSNGSAPVKYSG